MLYVCLWQQPPLPEAGDRFCPLAAASLEVVLFHLADEPVRREVDGRSTFAVDRRFLPDRLENGHKPPGKAAQTG